MPLNAQEFELLKKLSSELKPQPASTTATVSSPEKKTNLYSDIVTGAEKGAVESLGGIASIGNSFANQTAGRVINAVQGKGFTPTITDPSILTQEATPELKAQNTGELAGKVGEFAVEALLPTGKKITKPLEFIKKGLASLGEKKALQSGIKDIDAVTELVTEKAKKQNVITAAMEGRATQSGKIKSFDILPSAKDTEMAKDVLSVSKAGRNVAETLYDINKAIPQISENEVRPFLRANPRAFNVQTINSRLNAIEMPDLFKTDDTLGKTYNLVRQRMVQVIEKNPKTMEGLWDSRREFDKIVKEQFGDAAFDSEKNTAVKRAIQDMRREVNNFIGDEIGDNTFKNQMRRLSNLYEAQYNLGEKFYDLRNTNALKRWIKENPGKAKAIGIVGSTSGISYVLNKIFGN